MSRKKLLFWVGIFSLLLMSVSAAQAQSLPWVEVWVAVRDGRSGALLADAQVENAACAGLPADSCTRYGVWSDEKQVFVLKVPRLETYVLSITRSGYGPEERTGQAFDPVTTWDVRLYPADAPMIQRVYLPLIMGGGSTPPPVYNPTAAVNRLNWWRSLAGVGAVSGNLELHANCRAHARWMTNWQTAAHTEDPNLPGYTPEGNYCGQAAALVFGVNVFPTDEQAVDAILASPFHALAALDPRLVEVGFGSARLDTFWSGSYAAAALDVFHGVNWGQGLTRVTFPKHGGTLPLLSYNGTAQPDPLTACPGYTAPTGPALLVINAPSALLAHSTLAQGGTPLEHCVVTWGTYTHPNQALMQQGRTALAELGAVMVIPRQPLQAGKAYTVTLAYGNGETVSWSFTTSPQPLNILPVQVLLPDAD